MLASPAVTVAAVLAQQPGNGGQGEDFGKSSPVGLLLLILFLIAVVLLVRSMTKHLKRLPASFDKEEPAGAQKPAPDGDPPVDEPADEPGANTEDAPDRAKAGAKAEQENNA